MAVENLSFVLAERPKGDIIPGTTFHKKTSPAPSPSDLKDGQVLVESLYLSLDPAMRGWLNDVRSYVAPVKIGETMRGLGICRVIASRSSSVSAGDIIAAPCGWRRYAVAQQGTFEPPSRFPNLRKPTDMISLLGITGLSAWWGMAQMGHPEAGETVVVSGAAGAVGSVAGQIAKLKGARVVGICGSEDKCRWLTQELGFDVALNYKDADFEKKLEEATPEFINVYFDNVGGKILDMCMGRAKEHARFVLCGSISNYNSSEPEQFKNLDKIIALRIRMEGFIVSDHMARWPEGRKELSAWLKEDKIKTNETILQGGLESIDEAIVRLFKGANTGKLLLEVKKEDEAPAKL